MYEPILGPEHSRALIVRGNLAYRKSIGHSHGHPALLCLPSRSNGSVSMDHCVCQCDVGHLLRGRCARFTGGVFLSDQRVLPASMAAARARLAELVHDGWLCGASEAAYQGGIDHVLRVGPFGGLPGVSRLVRVQFLDPVDRDGHMMIGMRWEAVGVTGGLFPVLDADICLAAEGDERTRMTLTAVYRPPLGVLGAGLDRVLMHRVATATIHSLMTHMSNAMQGTAPAPAGDAGASERWKTEPARAS